MDSDGYKQKFIAANNSYYRAGNLLKRLLLKPEKYLSGQEALLIFNSYGIQPYELKLLLMSHGCEFDEDDFIRLLLEQKERTKNMKPCAEKDASDGIKKNEEIEHDSAVTHWKRRSELPNIKE